MKMSTDYGKIIVNPSEYTGKHSLTTSTGRFIHILGWWTYQKESDIQVNQVLLTLLILQTARGPISRVILRRRWTKLQRFTKNFCCFHYR